MDRKEYMISDDCGYTWERVWLTDEELEIACNNFFVVKEVID